jgi:hypothetical protein
LYTNCISSTPLQDEVVAFLEESVKKYPSSGDTNHEKM